LTIGFVPSFTEVPELIPDIIIQCFFKNIHSENTRTNRQGATWVLLYRLFVALRNLASLPWLIQQRREKLGDPYSSSLYKLCQGWNSNPKHKTHLILAKFSSQKHQTLQLKSVQFYGPSSNMDWDQGLLPPVIQWLEINGSQMALVSFSHTNSYSSTELIQFMNFIHSLEEIEVIRLNVQTNYWIRLRKKIR
jgi:hypothetical protein